MSASSAKKIDNILVVAITRLGDMLQSSPTIAGLKRHNPGARITVLIEKQFAKICGGIPDIDEVYVVDLGYVCRCLNREQDGIAEAYKYVADMVHELQGRSFDYCINMSNSAYTALLIKMLNAEMNSGWLADAEGFRLMADPWAMLFAAFVYHQNRDYNSLNLVDIFRCAAGVSDHPRQLCYRLSDESKSFPEQFLRERNLEGPGPLICIQAGASQGKRQWGEERFAALARMLVEQLGARVVFTGSKDEAPGIDHIIARCRHPRITSAAGTTNFDQLAGILHAADLLITGDTGPMHMAVAIGTPVVALFLASALCFETGPYSAGNFILQPQITCSPCNPNFVCSRPDCHQQISPELVVYLAKLRLSTAMGQEAGITIPRSVADPGQVVVYRTDFDEDGFLTFHSMNGITPRHGQPYGYFETARRSYSALWKEEFAGIPYRPVAAEQEDGARPYLSYPVLHESFGGLRHEIELAEEGAFTVDQLLQAISDPTAPARTLVELNGKLQWIDRELESVSLAYPLTGALVRIFIMEKENMRGSDPAALALEVKRLYLQLRRRSIRFWQLFSHFAEQDMKVA